MSSYDNVFGVGVGEGELDTEMEEEFDALRVVEDDVVVVCDTDAERDKLLLLEEELDSVVVSGRVGPLVVFVGVLEMLLDALDVVVFGVCVRSVKVRIYVGVDANDGVQEVEAEEEFERDIDVEFDGVSVELLTDSVRVGRVGERDAVNVAFHVDMVELLRGSLLTLSVKLVVSVCSSLNDWRVIVRGRETVCDLENSSVGSVNVDVMDMLYVG